MANNLHLYLGTFAAMDIKYATPLPQSDMTRDPRLAQFGLAPGGEYKHEKHCGLKSVIVWIFFPCICCCPIDSRETYTEPGGSKEVSASDLGLPVLVVSQFTLYADTRKGRRPTWDAAAPGPVAEPLVAIVADELASRGARVAMGRFGADMRVSLVNDGPTTIIIDVD